MPPVHLEADADPVAHHGFLHHRVRGDGSPAHALAGTRDDRGGEPLSALPTGRGKGFEYPLVDPHLSDEADPFDLQFRPLAGHNPLDCIREAFAIIDGPV